MSEDRYQINKSLGKGRTGEVYEAEDNKLQRKVALRRFFDEKKTIDFTEHEEEFLEVARSLSNLQHPNILKVFDAGVDKVGAYIVSQLLEGEALYEKITKGPMELYEVRQLARHMLDAFSLAHDQGYYHGALTPGSILMTPQARGGYRNVILDMGLSRLAPLTQEEDAFLTLMADQAILAPELFEGAEPDEKADLYMLGQILYMCLAGGHPYGGLSLEEAKEKHLEGLPSIKEYNQEVPEDIENWLVKLTAVEPEERYASAVEALSSLPEVPRPVEQFVEQAIEEVAQVETSSVQANPIKKTAVQQLQTATAPVPITAPGTAPVSATAPVAMPGTQSQPHHLISPNHETSSNIVVQPVKEKSSAGLFIGIGAAVALAAAVGIFMLVNKDTEGSQSEETSENVSSVNGENTETENSAKVTKALLVYFDGQASKHRGWRKNIEDVQENNKTGSGWTIDDDNPGHAAGLRYSLQEHAKKMFERGWRLTYKVSVGEGSHRMGFIFDNKLNPGWDGNLINCCVVLKATEEGLLVYSKDASYDSFFDNEPYLVPKGEDEWVTLTIEQDAKKASGDYVVKVNGKEIHTDKFTKGVEFDGHSYWTNHLFAFSVGRKPLTTWTIRDLRLETF